MPQPTPTTVKATDRYIAAFDRAVHDRGVLEEFRTIFAPDATVQLDHLDPVTGIDGIIEFYGNFLGAVGGDCENVWTTTELDDGRLEVHYVVASCSADGRLSAMSGIEHATLNADGLITNLRARTVLLENPQSLDARN
jgi:SnoaL-like protein